jgi:hypothetical protein
LIARILKNNVQGAEDVFDPSCYGEEEFGPEEEVAKKVKPARKKREAKKKETKAIIGQLVTNLLSVYRGGGFLVSVLDAFS